MSLNSKIFLCLSFVIVALGGPSLSGPLSLMAAAFGYALFWKTKPSFWLACGWFAAVQAVQWSWVSETHYMGPLIVVGYFFWCLALGLQFGLLSGFVNGSWVQLLGVSGLWVVFEWSRQFVLSGCFTWNPIGLSLAANDYSIQFASVFGIYGLCFWVVFTNLTAIKNLKVWACLALFPYLFGVCHQFYWEGNQVDGKTLSIALVQTAIRPEQRDLMKGKRDQHIPPLQQWKRVLDVLKREGTSRYDLIVLPEGSFPSGARRSVYPIVGMQKLWADFGALEDLPLLSEWVSNSFWLQSLANHYGSEVIAGLDDEQNGSIYNAAFHFLPYEDRVSRYEKQLLIPIGEYVPFKSLAQYFGISGSFSAGNKTKVFQGKVPIGISICLEETYADLVRQGRRAGAELFVNITNDVWFPNTRLPWHHFDHGRIRAAENGVYLLRSCNTGITSVINCFGQAVAILPVSEASAGLLSFDVPIQSHPTLYTFWGDVPVIFFSSLFFLTFALERRQKKKLLGIRVLD